MKSIEIRLTFSTAFWNILKILSELKDKNYQIWQGKEIFGDLGWWDNADFLELLSNFEHHVIISSTGVLWQREIRLFLSDSKIYF